MQPPSWLLPRPVIIRSSSFCLSPYPCSCCVMMQLFSALSDFKGVAREQRAVISEEEVERMEYLENLEK